MGIVEDKSLVRAAARASRRTAAAAAPDAAATIAAFAGMLPAADIVALYWPINDEVDPFPLGARLAARGALLALPAVAATAMTFRALSDGALVAGPFGTMEPAAGAPVQPGMLLVPLLAFTRAGHRLGYGQGYYDRWLAAHPDRLAVGLAYAAQEVADLPLEPHDVPLAAILTEREAIVVADIAGLREGAR